MINLNSLSLPGKEYPKEALPAIYEQILRDNGRRTRQQLSTLRKQVIQHLMEMQDTIIRQNAEDVLTGKYKNEADMKARMPLYHDSDTMRNIPDEIMKWYAFTAWLNERTEKRVN